MQKGLIAATADQNGGSGIQWATGPSNWTISVPGTGTDIGTGSANTDKIIVQNGAGSTYAAGLADAYTNTDTGTGVYSDWYLPSKDELHQLYVNRVAIGDFNTTAFPYLYWSSSEYDVGFGLFWRFTDGTWGGYYKANSARVRAVRSF